MSETRHVLTILAVDDVARAAAFYVAAFGWTRTVEVPVYVELALPGGMRLGVYERHGYGANTGRAPIRIDPGEIGPTELYLRTDDLDGAVARAMDAGARMLSPCAMRAWGDDVAYLADLDGNVIALARA